MALLLSSCKTQSIGSGGTGGIPTAEEVNEYIDRQTGAHTRSCDDLKIDIYQPTKLPVVYPLGYPWKNDYSNTISEQFDKDYMKPLKTLKIDEADLEQIQCKGYNYATDEEKRKFWVIFLSAISKAESNFKPDEEYPEDNGTISAGLLQIDQKAGRDWCSVLAKEKKKSSLNMLDPKENLQCGLIMIQRQLMGVKTEPNGKFYQGKLFTRGLDYWYWSTLADINRDAKEDVKTWFQRHAIRQLPFCNRKNPIDGYIPGLSPRHKGKNCNEIQDPAEKDKCEKYEKNLKIELDIYMGENPVDNECKKINNSARHINKGTHSSGQEIIEKSQDANDSSVIQK